MLGHLNRVKPFHGTSTAGLSACARPGVFLLLPTLKLQAELALMSLANMPNLLLPGNWPAIKLATMIVGCTVLCMAAGSMVMRTRLAEQQSILAPSTSTSNSSVMGSPIMNQSRGHAVISRAGEDKGVNYNKEFGYSRKDVILIGVGLTALGYLLYYGLQAGGMDAGMAGNWVQLIIFVGICIGWVSTYVFRVATKVSVFP